MHQVLVSCHWSNVVLTIIYRPPGLPLRSPGDIMIKTVCALGPAHLCNNFKLNINNLSNRYCLPCCHCGVHCAILAQVCRHLMPLDLLLQRGTGSPLNALAALLSGCCSACCCCSASLFSCDLSTCALPSPAQSNYEFKRFIHYVHGDCNE